MRIFIYEYTCAMPAAPELPPSLRAEGRAMLAAVIADFQQIDGVQAWPLLADDFPERLCADARRTGHDEQSAFTQLAAEADYTLVIAPEFDDILTTRCEWVAAAG